MVHIFCPIQLLNGHVASIRPTCQLVCRWLYGLLCRLRLLSNYWSPCHPCIKSLDVESWTGINSIYPKINQHFFHFSNTTIQNPSSRHPEPILSTSRKATPHTGRSFLTPVSVSSPFLYDFQSLIWKSLIQSLLFLWNPSESIVLSEHYRLWGV